MTLNVEINKALVVLSPDLTKPAKPLESTLLQRAVALAKSTGCELELFHVCHEDALDSQLFTPDDELQQQREALTDRAATQVAEIATRLRNEGVLVQHEVCWDHPRTDAVLRKIAQSTPDVVMKQAREHSFLLGISSNTDWDLVRRSPVNVWLVNGEKQDINRIVAAVGNSVGDVEDITTYADYELFRTAHLIADTFEAEIYPVNAYQVPRAYAYLGASGSFPLPSAQSFSPESENREELLRRHHGSINAIADFFHIAKENVRISEGHPSEVIPDAAKSLGADMIVMGASSIGRLERLVNSVTVEPVMADANCDILIVRESDQASIPKAAKMPVLGAPKYDLEHAVLDPAAAFSSPQELANAGVLSIDLRRRILQAWEFDIRANLNLENEGGQVADINANILNEIGKAKASLGTKNQKAKAKQEGLNLSSAS